MRDLDCLIETTLWSVYSAIDKPHTCEEGMARNLAETTKAQINAMNFILDDHPTPSRYFGRFGDYFRDKYEKTGNIDELDAAIDFYHRAITADPSSACFLDNLEVSPFDKYDIVASTTRDESFLTEAIEIGEKFLNILPLEHPSRVEALCNLGDRFADRYSRLGAMNDLDHSIGCIQKALDQTSLGLPDRDKLLNSLSARYKQKYRKTDNASFLEKAINLGRRAIETAEVDDAILLTNLARALFERYSKVRQTADLEEGISLERRSLQATGQDNPERGMQLNNLALRLFDLWLVTRRLSHLDESIQLGREALDATGKDAQGWIIYSTDLATVFHQRYSSTGSNTDLEEAISLLQSALRKKPREIRARIRAGQLLVRYYALQENWQQGYKASVAVTELIREMVADTRSLDFSDNQHLLGEISGFASDAAAIASNADVKAPEALRLLEACRGVVAASFHELRADIPVDLEQAHPDLAEQFVNLRANLELSDTRNVASSDENDGDPSQVSYHSLFKNNTMFSEWIKEIRDQPGFQDFLSAPDEDKMRLGAQKGPIVVINLSVYRCDAIIITEHEIFCLALPKLTWEDAQKNRAVGFLKSPRALEWMWDTIASPVLEALGFTQPHDPGIGNWPHLWWIPTGPLSRFPLHAAGYHERGTFETVLDRVMSSYSSSVRAIIQGRQYPVRPVLSGPAVLVAIEDCGLPFAKQEIEQLQELCESRNLSTVKPGQYKQDVLSHLPGCSIFHFAGHGHTNINPLKSHLLLTDDRNNPLTVANLLGLNLRKNPPFLAYLSACETGQVRDPKFTDESLHLISAFQLAGFRHVIGTLWEVNDEISARMAARAYRNMVDGEMIDEAACRGLHEATRYLRYRWLEAELTARQKRRASKGRKASPRAKEVTREIVPEDLSAVPSEGEILRDVNLMESDEEGEEDRAQPLWVPYVHYGV
ncbi:CHAT domain-containing protein [Aspergillus multicolor]|uniref:CHAT domain-containing protein n=1 Tax=Aspergillus multicolor TaxID=41759 RepID=UPI003CCDE7FB